jgi:hypothetical protein
VGIRRRISAALFWLTLAPSSSLVPIATKLVPNAACISRSRPWSLCWSGCAPLHDEPSRSPPLARCTSPQSPRLVSPVSGSRTGATWNTVLKSGCGKRSSTGAPPRAHYNIGAPLLESGRSDKALAHYRAAAADEPEAHMRSGSSWKSAASLPAAAEYGVTSSGSRTAGACRQHPVGCHAAQIRRAPEAVASLEAALGKRPDDPDALRSLRSRAGRAGATRRRRPRFRGS